MIAILFTTGFLLGMGGFVLFFARLLDRLSRGDCETAGHSLRGGVCRYCHKALDDILTKGKP